MSDNISPRTLTAQPQTDRANAPADANRVPLTHDAATKTPSKPDAPLPNTTPTRPQPQFRSNTVAPSPPPGPDPRHNADGLDVNPSPDSAQSNRISPLRISTDASPAFPSRLEILGNGNPTSNLTPSRASLSLNRKPSSSSIGISRTPSLKAALAHSYGSGSSSGLPSPIISAMGDVTPLPSPLMSGDSPGPWKRLTAGSASPPRTLKTVGEGSALVTSSGESIDTAIANASKRKMYASLEPGATPSPQPADPQAQKPKQHGRNRSISDYVPDTVAAARRHVTVSAQHMKINTADSQEPHLRRELNFAESRGLTPTLAQPPTPPPSESSKDSSDGSAKGKPSNYEYFEARGRYDNKRRRWRSIRLLGQGTFSRVMLATSQMVPDDDAADFQSGLASPTGDSHLDRKTLVAVKICEHGPRGGASEERVEMSLKRELEILQSIHHPSLVDLKAWSIEPTRAILILSYCAGGDLFDVATTHRNALGPALLRRVFAELVGAVSYLHERRIVHRDIKLENVLVNLMPSELENSSIDWATYPYPVINLTDLGLSRRIADDEKLETRCGSEDYAAPEVIMGQPYDGRATDAWSLGVLLYALLEARLPFDPHPSMSDAHRMRSRTSHRIARVEWRWVEYGGDDTDHDGDEGKFREKGLLGALEITEGLLKRARSRWSVEKVANHAWVRDAMSIEGGLQFSELEDGQEVS
ncbi:Serine/threonine-protein kinase PRR1 [Paramyrothecium foliicola]|nr:Serine/threonine-protein kinase PRR1 [Paramyrothecium foliicola]